MDNNFLIINRSILPDFFELVLQTKKYVDDDKMSVSDACKKTGISRSTFYKYKDNIFIPSDNYGKKAIIGIKTADKAGVLSNILSVIASSGANVITINQDMPINRSAYITITIDIKAMSCEIAALIDNVKEVASVKSANIIAIE
ncbi:MAG: ACT domain-containing protein [Christensenellaceae bacterium]